jgi:hypothetical protein
MHLSIPLFPNFFGYVHFAATRPAFAKTIAVLAILFQLTVPHAHAQEDVDTESLAKATANQQREKLSKSVQEISGRLDDVKKSVRDAAEQELLTLGLDAMEFLPAVNDKESDEWKMRIDRLRSEFSKLEFERITKPSLVTLKGTMSGREALTELSKQTGIAIPLGELENLEDDVDTEFENTPFWEAFDEILDQMDLTVPASDGGSLLLTPRRTEAPLRIATAGYCGLFRLEPISIQKLLPLNDPARGRVQVQLLLSWEPRLNPVFVQFPMDSMKLVCDDGKILSTTSDSQEYELVGLGGAQMLVDLSFQLPTHQSTKISRWTGKMSIATPGVPATLEFTDLMKASKTSEDKSASVGNLTVILEKARKNRDIYEVLVGVRLKGTEKSAGSFRGWSDNNEAYLLDKTGKRVEHVGWSTTRMTENEIGLSYLFDIDGGLDDCTFVYRAPANLIDQSLEFVLEDVPLP